MNFLRSHLFLHFFSSSSLTFDRFFRFSSHASSASERRDLFFSLFFPFFFGTRRARAQKPRKPFSSFAVVDTSTRPSDEADGEESGGCGRGKNKHRNDSRKTRCVSFTDRKEDGGGLAIFSKYFLLGFSCVPVTQSNGRVRRSVRFETRVSPSNMNEGDYRALSHETGKQTARCRPADRRTCTYAHTRTRHLSGLYPGLRDVRAGLLLSEQLVHTTSKERI